MKTAASTFVVRQRGNRFQTPAIDGRWRSPLQMWSRSRDFLTAGGDHRDHLVTLVQEDGTTSTIAITGTGWGPPRA